MQAQTVWKRNLCRSCPVHRSTYVGTHTKGEQDRGAPEIRRCTEQGRALLQERSQEGRLCTVYSLPVVRDEVGRRQKEGGEYTAVDEVVGLAWNQCQGWMPRGAALRCTAESICNSPNMPVRVFLLLQEAQGTCDEEGTAGLYDVARSRRQIAQCETTKQTATVGLKSREHRCH